MSDVQEVITLKVLSYSLTSLIVLVTLLIGVMSNFVLMFSFLTASLAASVIGSISVFTLVILMSPNHVSNSNAPVYLKMFQEKIQVPLEFNHQTSRLNHVSLQGYTHKVENCECERQQTNYYE